MILHIGFPDLLVIAFLQLKFSDVNIMEIQKDFREFFALLNAHKVHFIIVGGYALAFHGAPRYTGNIDVFVQPDHNNVSRIMKALADFGK